MNGGGMSIGLEWILSAVITIVGGLVAVIWSTLNKKIEVAGGDLEKQEKAAQERFADVWQHINRLRDDTVEIKEMRGVLTAKIESLESQIKGLPSYKDFHEMLRESEERIEARLAALVGKVRSDR